MVSVYILGILLVIVIVVLLLRVRVRFEVTRQRRLLFVGLGRSGPEIDFENHVTRVKLLGFTVKSIRRVQREVSEAASEINKERSRRIEELQKEQEKERAKLRTVQKGQPAPPGAAGEAMELVRENKGPLWGYARNLWHDLIIEELHGQIEGGFESPYLTGQAYGFFHAVVGAVPALAGRVSFIPVWTGRSLSGNFRAAVALPLYLLVYRTLILVVQLPVRRILRLVKRLKKGVRYGAE